MLQWHAIQPGQPLLTHPGMAVIRDGELYEACRILDAIGRPSPSTRKEDIDLINDHICDVLQHGPAVPVEVGVLKKVKVRMCLDMSINLNRHLKHWPFSYASFQDAVALLEPSSFMAKIDLER